MSYNMILLKCSFLFLSLVSMKSVCSVYEKVEIDNLISRSEVIYRVKVNEKIRLDNCEYRDPCDQLFLYNTSVIDRLKGDGYGLLFFSEVNLEYDREYLVFGKGSARNRRGKSCFPHIDLEEIYRMSLLGELEVVDVPNPPKVDWPADVRVYEAHEIEAKEGGWYFSINWHDLKSYITNK